MQLLAKFKQILYMGFRATLNFRKFKGLSCICVSHMTNYVNFKRSKDVEKNPGPTQYNTDHHEVIIRPFMQNHSSTMQLTSPISSENLMQSRLGELGLQSIDFGGQVIVSLDLYHIDQLYGNSNHHMRIRTAGGDNKALRVFCL